MCEGQGQGSRFTNRVTGLVSSLARKRRINEKEGEGKDSNAAGDSQATTSGEADAWGAQTTAYHSAPQHGYSYRVLSPMKTTFICGGCGKKLTTERMNPLMCLKCIAKMVRKEAPVSESEIAAAIANPRYRFEERVQKMVDKGTSKKEAEKQIREVIATKELPGDRPHLHFTSEGEAYFSCADIAFKVDLKDLNKVLGTNGEHSPLDGLMDSQIAGIAYVMGISTTPFVRDLLMDPIRHLVQMVWYRDLQTGVDYTHLEKNMKISLDRYRARLLEYRPESRSDSPVRPRSGHPRSPRVKEQLMSKRFISVVSGSAKVASGRESDLYSVISSKQSMTFAEIVAAAQGKVKTRQNFEMIVMRFLRELIGHGAVKEV